MRPAQILEDDVGTCRREIVAAETLGYCITANDPRWAFTEEHGQQAQQSGLARTVFAIDGDVPADIEFNDAAAAVGVDQDDASKSEVQSWPLGGTMLSLMISYRIR